MAATQLNTKQIADNSINKDDINVSTTTKALITKVIAGTNITFSSTGVDAGTGDVTINASAGSGITRSINNISTTTTGAAVASTDYVYIATGTFIFTLPTAVGNTNLYTLKVTGTGTITIATTAGQTVDNAAPGLVTFPTSLDFISNNSNWFII